jgi:CRP/FNR family transcriptional regulator
MNLDTLQTLDYQFEKTLIEEISKVGTFKSFKKNDTIIDYNQSLIYMPLLLEGSIKIFRQNNEGDELILYYLEKGDTCSMSMSCCMGSRKSEIRAEAESDCNLILVPVEYMALWIQKYDSWRKFVFDSYQGRFNELLTSIDSLAFTDMHGRIIKYLRDKVIATKSEIITSTHQEIANEMNTSRVVISRILKRLEKENIIMIKRNSIQVLEF